MGFFKQMKDMKDTVAAAPGMIQQANEMAANAQQYQASQAALMAQQQAVMPQAMAFQAAANGTLGAQPGNLDPIAGVSIELFAQIAKAIAPHNYDQSLLPGIAASRGVDGASWEAASAGWNARIQADPAVGVAFNQHYRNA